MTKKRIIDDRRNPLRLVGRVMLEACLRHGVGGIPVGCCIDLESDLWGHGVPPTGDARHLPHEGGGEGNL